MTRPPDSLYSALHMYLKRHEELIGVKDGGRQKSFYVSMRPVNELSEKFHTFVEEQWDVDEAYTIADTNCLA